MRYDKSLESEICYMNLISLQERQLYSILLEFDEIILIYTFI